MIYEFQGFAGKNSQMIHQVDPLDPFQRKHLETVNENEKNNFFKSSKEENNRYQDFLLTAMAMLAKIII